MLPSPLNAEQLERRRNQGNNHISVGARTEVLEGTGGAGGQHYPFGMEQELTFTEQSLSWEEE